MSVKVDLGGFYTYTAYKNIGDDGTMPKFATTIDADGIISGSGRDNPGPFAIAGFLIGDEIRFIKQYTQGNGLVAWKYIGKRLEPKGDVYQFSGAWGQGSWQGGQWVLSGVAPPPPQKPTHAIVGHWGGTYAYANNPTQQDGPMSITIDLDDSKPYNPAGPFYLKGTGTDGIGNYDLVGTISADNDLDVEKTYHTSEGSWAWRYQGKFDGTGSINGIWREIRDDFAAAQGSFTLTKQQGLTKQLAQAFMPTAALYSVTPEANVASKISAAAAKNPQVPSAALQSLVTGFNTK